MVQEQGADSCLVRGLRLHEEIHDYGCKNSLNPPRPTLGVQPGPRAKLHLHSSPSSFQPPWEPLRSWKELGEPGRAREKQASGCCAFSLPSCAWSLNSAPRLRAVPLGGCAGRARLPPQRPQQLPTQGWLGALIQAPRHLLQPHTISDVLPLCFHPLG